MVEQVYNSLNKYFIHLGNTGYVKQSSVERLLLFTLIQEFVDNVLGLYLTKEDYLEINKALYCLYGSDCMIEYPDYYNPKTKRVMYTGGCSDLLSRIEELEETVANFRECTCGLDIDADIIVPSDDSSVGINRTVIVPSDSSWDNWESREVIIPTI